MPDAPVTPPRTQGADRASARRADLVVWVIEDGKPGHVNQSLGLAEAIARAVPTQIHRVPARSRWLAWLCWLLKRSPAPALPKPDLIVAAGHATHATLLAARRACGGRAVVLMKPSLPRRCFDLAIVPAHDGIPADAHTLHSTGALNRVTPGTGRSPARGVILLGGFSKHFDWSNEAVWLQVKSIVARTPDVHWSLATSRRTPPECVAGIAPAPNLEIATATTPDWLPQTLQQSGVAWVTPDSASMVCEALTAGCEVGVFDLPVNPVSRVGRAVAELADAQRVTRFVTWCAHGKLHPNSVPLAEADRCAALVLERFGLRPRS